ncbi:MAG: zinc-ribbon domain-containing protein [Lentisphaeria bacterium]|nr:zinc-ribbon domain-containing protein [Lentisphaeria bacterium]
MFCGKCGNQIPNGNQFCPYCGNPLTPVVVVDSGLSTFIPNNSYALWAYYLGIFSLLCGITAIPAFILGIMGVKYANQHPEAKGAVHAWVGIIMGFLCFACAALGVILFIINR